jgi:hypothetical protein
VVGARLTKAADLSDRQCTVIDISEGGARLRVGGPAIRQAEVSTEVRPDIACKIAWKKGDVIGIKFV